MVKLLKTFLLIFFVFDVLFLNIGLSYLVYLQFFGSSNSEKDPEVISGDINKDTSLEDCGKECQRYINLRIEDVFKEQNEEKGVSLTATPTKSLTRLKITRVSYVPISGNGSTLNTSWTDISGTDFYFDKSEYPGFMEATFEVNMKLFNGNGEGYIRLFDVTHSIGVSGSEVKTGSQSSVLVTSERLQFFNGRNLYRVQARSLTADTTIFESGRIKVVSQE